MVGTASTPSNRFRLGNRVDEDRQSLFGTPVLVKDVAVKCTHVDAAVGQGGSDRGQVRDDLSRQRQRLLRLTDHEILLRELKLGEQGVGVHLSADLDRHVDRASADLEGLVLLARQRQRSGRILEVGERSTRAQTEPLGLLSGVEEHLSGPSGVALAVLHMGCSCQSGDPGLGGPRRSRLRS